MANLSQNKVFLGVGYFTSNSVDVKRISRRALIRSGVWGTAAIAVEKTLLPGFAQGSKTTVKTMPAATAPGPSIAPATTSVSTPVHPTVYATPADVARARENVKRFAWAKKMADDIQRAADLWLTKEDAWIRSVVPAPGAAFALGTTGCPICNAAWGQWTTANASFDNPGHVKCANGHVLPDAEHPDPGTGYVAKDGRIHYMVGSYNAWAIEQLVAAANNLAHAYALTGDERYAEKAAVIMDAQAAIYPTCTKGAWDYPSNPPSGRFHRPWFQVARAMIVYVDQYDHICASTMLDKPSITPGLTRRRNIEDNLLKNGATYCYEESKKETHLNNGTADYIRGSLAVGVCLDIPEWVRWAVEGPLNIYAMLDNNLGRDGTYFETSFLYAGVSRGLYTSFAEPLFNYRGIAYPNGVNLYTHPKFRKFMALHNTRQELVGHSPRYGDMAADIERLDPMAASDTVNAVDYTYIERLYARTLDATERQEVGRAMNWLARGDVEARRNKREHAGDRWLLFHAEPFAKIAEANLTPAYRDTLLGSSVLGQKGMALLRREAQIKPTGTSAITQPQGLLLRYGPSLSHGHYDDLNINFFSHGYELTYDLGYGLGSTHTMVGWVKQTASHNLVVVDEKAQSHESPTGGSLHLFAALPGVQLAEASSEGSYVAQGVTLYRRTVALINGYCLDIFRVKGGQQHDYLLHTLGKNLDVAGVTLGPAEAGSLAGQEISWGSKQLNDGDMEGHPNQPYWNPPPGNGYGFLVEPRRGTTNTKWSAQWEIDEKTRLYVHVPATPDAQVITALAPGVTPAFPKARYLVQRRRSENQQPLQSSFVSVLEPQEGASGITSVEKLPLTGRASAIEPVALRVVRSGTTDVLYSAGDAELRQMPDLKLAAHFASLQLETSAENAAPSVASLSLVGARQFEGFGWRISPQSEAWSGSITAVDLNKSVLTTRAPLPEGDALRNQMIYLRGPGTSRNTVYRIERVERTGNAWNIVLDETTILGRGVVQSIKNSTTLVSSLPHEYARSLGGHDTGFFTGKRVETHGGVGTSVLSVKAGPPFEISVASTRDFKVGDVFFFHDVAPRDEFQIFSTVSLEKLAPNRYHLKSPLPVKFKAPKGVEVSVEVAGRKI